MRVIKFAAYLFYKYYSKGNNSIPYAGTITALTLLLFMHILQILLLINRIDLISDFDAQHRGMSFLRTGLLMLPGFVLLLMIIKKSELEKMYYDDVKIKIGNIYLVFYIILSILLLIFLIWYRRGLGI